MSRECAICGKKPIKAAKISFSHKQNVHRQNPNLQSIKVCTSCIRANKVHRAV